MLGSTRQEHPELIEERKKSDLPEKPKTPQQLWYNHEKKTYMKVHPEVHTHIEHTHSILSSDDEDGDGEASVVVPGESEGAEGGSKEAMVSAVRQKETEVDQQGPGAPEGLRGTKPEPNTGRNWAEPHRVGLNDAFVCVCV